MMETLVFEDQEWLCAINGEQRVLFGQAEDVYRQLHLSNGYTRFSRSDLYLTSQLQSRFLFESTYPGRV